MVDRWYARAVSARDDGPLVFFGDYARLLARVEAAEARNKALVSAISAVVWFDWSDNDDDAVAAIARLRALSQEGSDA